MLLRVDPAGAAPLTLAIPAIVLLVLLGSSYWRVRVNAAGLRVRSVVGFPRWSIPVADVAAGSAAALLTARIGQKV